ncbi:MAG: hypothetical protein M1838_002946 [Thelocarpon superellum]|nr:MAG: hypothetical protein M1838_002946 [Thelocarpon superellum]
MSAGENQAAWLLSEKGAIEVGAAEIAQPEAGQTQAAPVQPVEVKIAKLAVLKLSYPTVLGSTAGGFVEAVGEGVTKVRVGDRVVAGTNAYPSKGVAKYGSQQRYTIADARECVLIGDLDFAVAVASCAQTPPAALFARSTLGMERPVDALHPTPKLKKIYISGGSSAMGLLAIGYAKQAGYTVVTTCSPHNFPLVHERGADYVYDYHNDGTPAKIHDLLPIDYWLDTVSLPSSMELLIKILTPPGRQVVKARIITLLPPTMPGMPKLPDGVTAEMMLFRNKAEENQELVDWLLASGGYMERGLKGGWIRGVPPERLGGLDQYAAGVERMSQGVSGKKLVIEPWT